MNEYDELDARIEELRYGAAMSAGEAQGIVEAAAQTLARSGFLSPENSAMIISALNTLDAERWAQEDG